MRSYAHAIQQSGLSFAPAQPPQARFATVMLAAYYGQNNIIFMLYKVKCKILAKAVQVRLHYYIYIYLFYFMI